MRLIDADACRAYFYEHLDDNGVIGAMNAIDSMPTVYVDMATQSQVKELERERDAAVDRCVNADDVSAGYYHEIKQLEADNARLQESYDAMAKDVERFKRERDAAVDDMTELIKLARYCRHCKYITANGECTCDQPTPAWSEPWCWEWRGVQEVE